MRSWKSLGLVFGLACFALSACSGSGSNGSTPLPDGGKNGQPGQSGADGGIPGGDEDGSAPLLSDGGKPPTGTDGSVPKTDSGGGAPPLAGATNVQIITEPNGNDDSELVAAIKAAKKSVHMTMYLLDESSVVTALIAQHKAGLDVKVVLNQTFPSGTTNNNPATYTQLQTAGVGVVWANARFQYTHEKTVILDGTTAWIMTMNIDQTSPTSNREYLVVDSEAADATEADAIFNADYSAAGVITATGSLVVAPEPPNNCRSAIVQLVNSATKTLDIEAEEFSDFGNSGDGVTQAVVAAATRKVKVRLVLAQGTPDATQTEAIGDVKAAGGSVVVSGAQSGSGNASSPYIHAKVMVVDCDGTTCANGYIGSENFTGGSLGYNRELGVIVSNGTELQAVDNTIDGDFKAGTAQ